jgi:two-component system KDP operon response regulator KdpE
VDLIREVRTWSASPIIVLSARSAETDKIQALDAGADDYLVKPFSAGELLARVRAQLRRHSSQSPAGQSLVTFGDIVIDLGKRSASRQGQPLHLTPIEYRLLTYLSAHPERVLTHQQLLQAVWGPGHASDTHYVRVHMANLRKKIEHDAARPEFLHTELGVGYRFVPGQTG